MSLLKTEIAFKKGYRVKWNSIYSPNGTKLKLDKVSHGYYPRFGISHRGKRFGVKCHHLTAYQKYGPISFSDNLVIRHLDDDPINFRPGNITLGTPEQNVDDKYINLIIRYWMEIFENEEKDRAARIPLLETEKLS